MQKKNKLDTSVTLSTLWIIIMLNMIFADIYSIMVELVKKNTLDIPDNVEIIMLVAVFVTNIPLMMIYLSRVLHYRTNRLLNIIAGFLTIIYVVGGGSTAPHYIAAATIEIVFLVIIIVTAWRWKNIDEHNV